MFSFARLPEVSELICLDGPFWQAQQRVDSSLDMKSDNDLLKKKIAL